MSWSRTWNLLDRALVRVSVSDDGKWEIHQANKPVVFRPLASLSTVTNEVRGLRIFNVILGPLSVDIGII